MTTHHLLVDFENVPVKSLAKLSGHADVRIKVFLGKNNNKLGTELVMAMQALGHRAEYVRLTSTGPNALDFHIACYLGRILTADAAARCTVISKDKGFDALIAHLVAEGRQVARHPSIDAVPDFKGTAATKKPRAAGKPSAKAEAPEPAAGKAAAAKEAPKPAPSRTSPKGRRRATTSSAAPADANFDRVLALLVGRKKSLPAKRKALLGTILGRIGKDQPAEEAERICNLLIARGYVSEADGRLSFELPDTA
jgi:hypothetical protein